MRAAFYRSPGQPSCHVLKLECRRWFGLMLCFGPHKENWIEKGWYDMGERVAVERWNEAVVRGA